MQVGSAVGVFFHQPTMLAAASAAVLNLRLVVTGSERPVWLMAKKEHAELKPNKVTHRLGDYLTQLKKDKGTNKVVRKRLDAKFVEVGGKLAAFTYQGNVKFTSHGGAWFTDEEMQVAKA